MSDDIVERLRTWRGEYAAALIPQAADEIERLRAELEDQAEYGVKLFDQRCEFEKDRDRHQRIAAIANAEAAAMREVLGEMVDQGIRDELDDVSDWDGLMRNARQALAPDAGRKVLAVVEAAKTWRIANIAEVANKLHGADAVGPAEALALLSNAVADLEAQE